MEEKCMKNGEIYHFWAKLGDLYWYTFGHVPVLPSRTEPVPVQVRAVPVVFCFSILTSVCILAITFSFLIRFE